MQNVEPGVMKTMISSCTTSCEVIECRIMNLMRTLNTTKTIQIQMTAMMAIAQTMNEASYL